MDIPSTTSATTTTTRTGVASTKSDYQTFLTMLTAQIQNQDPLNPMESSDFAVQLATFSGVEQQTKTNQLLEGMAASFDMMGMAQLAAWIGNEALVEAPVWFGGEPVTLLPEAATGATSAVLVVRDDEGNVVVREDVPVDSRAIAWAGEDATGARLLDGSYGFTLESYAGEALLGTSKVAAYGEVVEARADAGGAVLVLKGGGEVAAADILGLRAAT